MRTAGLRVRIFKYFGVNYARGKYILEVNRKNFPGKSFAVLLDTEANH